METYTLKREDRNASTEIVWAFDLGKGSIGEAVRRGAEFLHKASLLIPAEFAETKTAAGRRRMWRTRQLDSKETLIGAIKQCHQTLWGGGKLSPQAAFWI